MRIELPSVRPDGSRNWLELRDKPRPLDYLAVQEAAYKVDVEVKPDGTEIRHASGGSDMRMQFAMLSRALTAWSFDGIPVPARNIGDPMEVIDSALADPDDFDKACDAIQPLLDRVLRRPKPAQAPAETAQPES